MLALRVRRRLAQALHRFPQFGPDFFGLGCGFTRFEHCSNEALPLDCRDFHFRQAQLLFRLQVRSTFLSSAIRPVSRFVTYDTCDADLLTVLRTRASPPFSQRPFWVA